MKSDALISQKELARFCRRWQIYELALFGSILRADFSPKSDIDVLVAFKPAANWGLFEHVQMRNELRELFGREVDLITRRALEQSQNNLLREHIMQTAKVIYDEQDAYVQG